MLVGDPDQLASVEAGAVLGDLVDRTTTGRRTPALAERLLNVLPDAEVEVQSETPGARVRDGVTTLRTNHRAEVAAVARLAELVQAGDANGAIELLRSGAAGVELVEVDDDTLPGSAELGGVRTDVLVSAAALHEAAAEGDAAAAVHALDMHRLLCAHRRGPRGVSHWSSLAAGWLAEQHPVIGRPDGHYAGEPLIVTHNDYDIGLYNGDTGAIIEGPGGSLVAAFARGGAPLLVPIARIGDVRPLHALTVHRSQGSQFTRVTVILPPATSHLGTRETIYTAVSRATQHVRLIGSSDALGAAIRRPAARATGLRERLQRAP